ncbi:PREDICTED: heme-binding protein 2-like [Tarenaya hassleriana]|uniref:heme-binding protein 2-like n=1 Tax=Tarenaya hassleriana TaxID=28532 RepID=UPI00053C6E7E|nr:PREDICTED: heme-binding protein 2-like [Tarenaya hassleriana]
MQKPWIWVAWSIVVAMFLCVARHGEATETPQYEVVHTESDFEIRLYRDSVWMSITVCDLSFQKATLFGFHRLFQYIQGANLNFSRIPMTSPVLTSIVPEAGPLHSSAYKVLFYLPAKFQADPPVPLAELHLKPYKWDSHYVAVRKFAGFARDDRIVREAEKLGISLRKSLWANCTSDEGDFAYSIAQYDSPFRLIGRKNEVWVDVVADELGACKFSGVAVA